MVTRSQVGGAAQGCGAGIGFRCRPPRDAAVWRSALRRADVLRRRDGPQTLWRGLEQHREALAEYGVRAPARSADEAFRAAVEVRREHKAWGLRRRDVEGTWSGICRRALKHRDSVVVGLLLSIGVLLHVPRLNRLPTSIAVVTVGACVSTLFAHTHNYPGRMSIHLAPFAIAMTATACARLFGR